MRYKCSKCEEGFELFETSEGATTPLYCPHCGESWSNLNKKNEPLAEFSSPCRAKPLGDYFFWRRPHERIEPNAFMLVAKASLREPRISFLAWYFVSRYLDDSLFPFFTRYFSYDAEKAVKKMSKMDIMSKFVCEGYCNGIVYRQFANLRLADRYLRKRKYMEEMEENG